MDSLEKIKLSENLRHLFHTKNISLHLVAAKTNINKSTLHNYLNGVIPQGLIALIKLSDYFNLDIEDLIFSETGKKEYTKSQNMHSEWEEKYEITIKRVKK